MKVLVTGGAGYLGAVVAKRLLAEGYCVRVLDSLMHGGHALEGLYQYDDFEFCRGDIRSVNAMASALEGVDVVIHLAAIVGDPACATNPKLAREVNIDASLQLFNLCQQRGVNHFVFASTCSNYGNSGGMAGYVTEESELRPVSLYAETKVAVEKSLQEGSLTSGIALTILRFATAFGLSPRMRFDLTVNEFTLELLTKRKLLVYGEQFWRPYVHVFDIATAVKLAIESSPDEVDRHIFNVGDTRANYQKAHIVDLISAEIGGEVQIDRVLKEEDPRNYRVSFERIKKTLGFRAEHTVRDGVREIIRAITQGVITDLESPRYRN